jgi:hypothetical protein
MTSLRSLEGYMLIDHRNSPGVSDELMVKAGYIPGAGQGLYESATYTCPYCETVVVIEPKRTRPRAFDRKTGRYICDPCKAAMMSGALLVPIKEIADRMLNRAAKGLESEVFQSPVIGV